MNFKKFSLIFMIFFILILSIGAISAANDTDVASDTSEVESTQDSVVVEDTSAEVTSEPQKAVKKIPTDVDADEVMAVKGKNSYFKVEVENERTDSPVKNIKLNVKVVSKSKSKVFVIKTNSRGIAKLNTKSLGLGDHKVIITSADVKYKISKKSKIFIGKKHVTTMKINSKKVLSNKDTIKTYTKYDDDDKEIKFKVIKGGSVAKTKIYKVKFYFKNKYNGRTIVKTDYYDYDHGKWECPEEDYDPYRYTPLKLKVWYLTA